MEQPKDEVQRICALVAKNGEHASITPMQKKTLQSIRAMRNEELRQLCAALTETYPALYAHFIHLEYLRAQKLPEHHPDMHTVKRQRLADLYEIAHDQIEAVFSRYWDLEEDEGIRVLPR